MNKTIAALFDFDGVIVDTESHYTKFWDAQGIKYHPEIANFASGIKGNTLVQVFEKYFACDVFAREQITKELNDFETSMPYDFIEGVLDFLQILKSKDIKTAIVTSSNNKKMEAVFNRHTSLRGFFDEVITSECVKKSKPDPECFLLGGKNLGRVNNFVFEDSIAGLTAAKASKFSVIGLSTTHSKEKIETYCDLVIPNFKGFDEEIFMQAKKK